MALSRKSKLDFETDGMVTHGASAEDGVISERGAIGEPGIDASSYFIEDMTHDSQKIPLAANEGYSPVHAVHATPIQSNGSRQSSVPVISNGTPLNNGQVVANPVVQLSLGDLGERMLGRLQALWTDVEATIGELSVAEPVKSRAKLAALYRKVGLEVDLMLRTIASREMRSATPSEGILRAISRLGAGAVEEQLIEELIRFSRLAQDLNGYQQLASSSDEGLSFDAVLRSTLQKLQRLVQWYLRRRSTVQKIEQEQEYIEEEGIFVPVVRHDVVQFGVSGFEVSCALRLNHRAGQQLWLKGVLYRAGRPIHVRSEWELWQDDTDALFVDSSGSKKPFSELGRAISSAGDVKSPPPSHDDRGTFATLLPLAVARNCCVIDSAKLFVPYGALAIPDADSQRNGANKSARTSPIVELELELLLLDEANRTLSSRAATLTVNTASFSDRAKRSHAIPSPQAAGLWPEDPISGDGISRLRYKQGMRGGARGPTECLTVGFDLELNGRGDDDFRAELRLLDGMGDLVQRRLPVSGIQGSTEQPRKDFSSSISIRPQDNLARYSGLKFEVPLGILDLKTGKHNLVAEVAIVGKMGQVVVGAMLPVTLNVPAYIEQLGILEVAADNGGGDKGTTPLVEQAPQVVDAQLAITTAVYGGERFNSSAGVRIRTKLAIASQVTSNLRVVFSIQTLGGDPLVAEYPFGEGFNQRRLLAQSVVLPVSSLLSDGDDQSGTPELSAWFDNREIISALGGRSDSGAQTSALAVKVRVFANNDALLGEQVNQFAWNSEAALAATSTVASGKVGAHQRDLGIVDFAVSSWLGMDKLACKVWCNVPAERVGQAVLSLMLIDGFEGKPLVESAIEMKLSEVLGHGFVRGNAMAFDRPFERGADEIVQATIPVHFSLAKFFERHGVDQADILNRLGKFRVRIILAGLEQAGLQSAQLPLFPAQIDGAKGAKGEKNKLLSELEKMHDIDTASVDKVKAKGGSFLDKVGRFFVGS